ncbi:MAG: 6-bladed beta-propeller [Bacteroidales bacterium]|nr:6-bladed beta-propeller [Bacteroidales bacterium]
MKSTTLFLSLLTIVSSCKRDITNTSVEAFPIIDIEKNFNAFKSVNLSEIANDVNYIPLETNNDCLITYVHQLLETDDRFIFGETKSCKAFDKNGKYLCSYGSIGNGPGQHNAITQVSINSGNKHLYLSGYRFFMEYDPNGNFVRKISVPELIDNEDVSKDFVCVSDSLYWCIMKTSNLPVKMYLFNDNGIILKSYPNYYNDPHLKENLLAYYDASRSIFEIADKIIFKDGLCDTVFYFNEYMQRKPAYCFYFGIYSQLQEYLKSLSDYRNTEELKGAFDHLQISKLIETDDFLFFTCHFGKHLPKTEFQPIDEQKYTGGVFSSEFLGYLNPVKGLFNRRTSEVIFLKKIFEYKKEQGGFSGFANDIDGGVPFWPILQTSGKKLVSIVYSYDLKEYVASERFIKSDPINLEKKLALKRLADSLRYNDNPVLMITTPK